MSADEAITKAMSKGGTKKDTGRTDGELYRLLDFLGIDRNTPANMLSQVTYFTCIRVMSEGIGKIPLKIYKQLDRGVLTQTDHRLWHTLNQRPNRYMPATLFWSTMERMRSHRGNAFALITGSGSNIQLWPLDPDRVTIVIDNAKMLSDQQDVYYQYGGEDGNLYMFKSDEIIHLRTWNTRDGILGIPVMEQLREFVNNQSKAEKMLGKMLDSGFTAKAVVQYTGNLSDDNVKRFVQLLTEYAEEKKAYENAKYFIPAPLGATITPLNVKLADNEFAELTKYSALQIAAAFGIKPTQINDYTKSSYSSEEAQQLNFYKETLLYPMEMYEQELTYKLFLESERKQGLRAGFDTKQLLRVTQEQQMTILRSGIANFIFTPNEAREQLDLPPVEGGDKLIGNGTNIPIDMVGQQYTKTQQAEGGEEDG